MILLDTHVLVWILSGDRRLRQLPFLDRRRPWVVSPIVLLEYQYLCEVSRPGTGEVPILEALAEDDRFQIDDAPFLEVVRHAIGCGWTRDPFDRLIAAQSSARRIPLCTLDATMLEHHPLLVPELRPPRRRRR